MSDDAEDQAPDSPAPDKKKQKSPSFSEAWHIAKGSKPVVGTPRQLYAAGLLGTCIVFVASMLTLPRLDSALHVALFAFAIAMPPLALEFAVASSEFKPTPQTLRFRQYKVVSNAVAGIVGSGAVYVGITAALWHLSDVIAQTFLLASVMTFVVTVTVTRIIYPEA